MSDTQIQHIRTIEDFHRLRHLPRPLHPLVSLVDYGLIRHSTDHNEVAWIQDFYSVGLKRDVPARFQYGQQLYDFDEGLMSFIAPGQVYRIRISAGDYETAQPSGWLLLFHPDFLWNSTLAGDIHDYEFFGYSVHESLFLSEKEEGIITTILQNIGQEYRENIDGFTQSIIVSQIETLLNYARRFYQRQFTTRVKSSHQILERMEEVLHEYFGGDSGLNDGLPTVGYIAQTLNLSPNYLSSLLKSLTGKSTQEHIQDKVIEKARERLSTTNLTVSEIAYELGFEYPQSFSKLFKARTDQSPMEFRQSFN